MKTSPFIVGITGGIGSGKSLVCKIFFSLGIPIYDADSRAKWLTNNDQEIRQAVIKNFGDDSFIDSGLNRNYISNIVFNDSVKLNLLNSIIHPAVGNDFKKWVSEQSTSYVIKEAALMFESSSYKQMDSIINVSAPAEIRIKRVQARDSFRTTKEIESIIRKQLSEKERTEKSDYVIKNDGKSMVIHQVLELHQAFLKASSTKS